MAVRQVWQDCDERSTAYCDGRPRLLRIVDVDFAAARATAQEIQDDDTWQSSRKTFIRLDRFTPDAYRLVRTAAGTPPVRLVTAGPT